MSSAMHKRRLREIEMHLDAEIKGVPSPFTAHEMIEHIRVALRPKKFVVAAKKRVKSKKAERQDEWEQIREKVIDRALGRCECGCGAEANTAYGHGLEVDHMFGGSNRQTLQSIYTCWALIPQHHLWKTRNEFPGRDGWLKAFIAHCELMGDISHDAGYEHAAAVAQKKLDSLETMASIPDWNATPKGSKQFNRDLEIGGPRDQELRSAIHRKPNTQIREKKKR